MIYNQEAAFHVLDNCVSFAGYGTGYLVNIGTGSPLPLPISELQFLKGNFNIYLQDYNLSRGRQTKIHFNVVCMEIY